MTKDEALTLKALKYAASLGSGRTVREMNIEPFVIRSDKDLAQEQQSCDKAEERNFCSRCGKRLASGFVEISIHTCTPPQPEQEQEIEDLRTPEERRDAGQWHCPECFTFGNVHRRGCVTALKEKNT